MAVGSSSESINESSAEMSALLFAVCGTAVMELSSSASSKLGRT
ncbi:hypothetical protein [Paenibacillus sp. FSL H8-0259]|nr:hypothetical protein [Paenibacillus sp. FSL H8-0259]